ncbi:MAG: hypothetical protein ABIJ27_02690 [Candidatus Omnitrophota bacterium]
MNPIRYFYSVNGCDKKALKMRPRYFYVSNGMKTLSVICARAGSKGLPNKCITKIAGKMVIEYSIEYSLSLGENVRTVVSTDIRGVIDYCKANGIDCIDRDPSLCMDTTRIDCVLADAIEKKGRDSNYCSLVYGNIPVRYPAIFRDAITFLRGHPDYDAVMSMQEAGKFHPAWMFDYNTEILPKTKGGHYRRQMLSQKMFHDGHTVVFKSGEFLKRYKGLIPYAKSRHSIFGAKIKPLINTELIVDIDTERDLKVAAAAISRGSTEGL